jgi:phosphoheptose isomerase
VLCGFLSVLVVVKWSGLRKVQLVTPYRVTHLQRYEVMLCGNITSVCSARNSVSCHSQCYEVTLHGNVKSVCSACNSVSCHSQRYKVMLCGNITSVCSARNSISCPSLATLQGYVTR